MKKSKPKAKEKLIETENVMLNKMFYSDYNPNYFHDKAINLMYLMADTETYISNILDKELKVGEVTFAKVATTKDEVQKYSKNELISTYYHCLETFMRLFLSHAIIPRCPWVEMTSLNIFDYRTQIANIANNNFEFLNDKLNSDETILQTIIGCKDIKKIGMPKDNFTKIKNWIIWCAYELLNMSEYNSLKHGMAIFTGFGGFAIQTDEGEIKKEGDAIHILSKDQKELREIFSIKTIFADYDLKLVIIRLFSEMIRNIIIVGNLHYNGTEEKEISIPGLMACIFDYTELRKNLYGNDNLGAAMSSYSSELQYYWTKEEYVEFLKADGFDDEQINDLLSKETEEIK